MNMNMIEKLTTNIAKLFHEKGIRYEYEPDVIDDMLQHIDFGFLFNAITQAAQPVYCYSIDSDMPMTLKYCGPKMFPGNATRIYNDIDYAIDDDLIFTSHGLELWVLEDMSLAVTSCLHTEIGEDSYVTDYRAFKGQEWPDAELCIDLEDLLEELTGMYPEFFEPDECVMFEA